MLSRAERRAPAWMITGADLLASQGFRVVMPDFFKGARIDPALFGQDSEEA